MSARGKLKLGTKLDIVRCLQHAPEKQDDITPSVHVVMFDRPAMFSPVNLWFDLDKIATETLFVGTDSHTNPEQHIKNIEQSK